MIGALTWFLRGLGVPSIAFCWIVWIVFGQGSGGYVDPRTWTVLLLAAALAVMYEREACQDDWQANLAAAQRAKLRQLRRTQLSNTNMGLSTP
jgi:hypothetical protein